MSYSFTTLITGVSSIDELFSRIDDAGLKYKDDENVVIVYSESNKRTGDPMSDDIKSVIIDKKTFKPITSQFNKLYYNDDTENFLKNKSWSNVTVKECYEGTMIIVFNHANKWYVCTRKCIDAKKSFWIKNISYHDLFMQSIENKFTFDQLNPNYCYHFILLHYMNKNIVSYPQFGDRYMTVAHAMTTEKYTLKRVNYVICNSIIYPKEIKCDSIDDAKKKIALLSKNDVIQNKITIEGFIIEHIENDTITLLKLQTSLYTYVSSVKPNVSNIHAMFLELYQHDHYLNVAPFFVENSRDVLNRIHNAMKTITDDFYKIYHCTKNHKNPELYERLPKSYKDALYAIHGMYLSKKNESVKKQQTIDNEIPIEMRKYVAITINDIYTCLKNIDPYTLTRIFVNRLDLLNDTVVISFLKKDCFDTIYQGKLLLM